MTRPPLPEMRTHGGFTIGGYAPADVHAYTDACVAAETAALRVERDLLERGHKSALDGLRAATVRIKVLEDALREIYRTQYHIERPPIESLEQKMREIARAALDKP